MMRAAFHFIPMSHESMRFIRPESLWLLRTMAFILLIRFAMDYLVLSAYTAIGIALIVWTDSYAANIANKADVNNAVTTGTVLSLFVASSWIWVRDSLSLTSHTVSDSVTAVYLQSLVISVPIFASSCVFRGIFIIKTASKPQGTSAGFLGIVQRLAILVRTIAVTHIWSPYLACNLGGLTRLYYVIKGFFCCWLMLDLIRTIRIHWINTAVVMQPVRTQAVTDICCICRDRPTDPVKLKCGHIGCRECLEQWLNIKSECPMCRKAVWEKQSIEFADGSLPGVVLFAAF
jgi:hypothetical protein